MGKIKATFKKTAFVNFNSENVFEYLYRNYKNISDVEIINFFVCPFPLEEIIFRAD